MTHDQNAPDSSARIEEAPTADLSSVWSALADAWEDLFPLREPRTALCRTLIAPGGVFLDAGCGTGALVRALRLDGIDALGFDLDPGFVEVASRNLPGERVVRGDLREIAAVFPKRRFEAIVCLGQTFPHLLTDSDVASFLVGARSRLAPEGILVLQVVSDAGAAPQRQLPTLDAPGLRLERRRRVGDGRRAWLDLRVVRGELVHEWTVEHRVWTPESLCLAASESGFVPKWLAADESGKPWTGREPGFLQAFVPA
jgi:SAM-dependent methyltransferase